MPRSLRLILASRRRIPLVVLLAAIACNVRKVEVTPVAATRSADATTVTSPVKAHLLDGTSLYYPAGVTLKDGVLVGQGIRHDLRSEPIDTVDRMPLDSIVGMESYAEKADAAASFTGTLLGIAGGAFLTAAAAVAIFGSCPTLYVDSAGSWQLEAEGFSYSMAALYESRDVDRLRVQAAADGTVRVEVRNEALETHYINHLELLEVRHAPDEFILPDASGLPLAVSRQRAPLRATDRFGHDIGAVIATADGNTTRSDFSRPGEGDGLEDHLDLTVPVPAGADSVALVLRLRNSLLNTVLLYDVMLGSHGLESLQWQNTALREIGPALEVAQWYGGNMGLRIMAVTDSGSREVARIRDTGPIAWKDVAVMIPATGAPTMQLRLESVIDNWRIDRITVAVARRPAVRHLSLAEAIDASEHNDTSVLAALAAPDANYLETVPGQRFTAVWRPEVLPTGAARTFLLASQGYYIEWMRRDWLAAPRRTTPFRPARSVIAEAVEQWRGSQATLERDFFNSRLPVR